MTWLTPETVKNLWAENAPENPPSDEKLQLYIETFEAQIKARYPQIQDRIDNSTLDILFLQTAITQWIFEYVQRAGSPYTQESQSYTGVASRSVTMESRWRKSLILTSDDLDIFMPGSKGKAFSINTAPKVKTRWGWYGCEEDVNWYTIKILG